MYGTVKLCPGSGALLGALTRSTGGLQMPVLVCVSKGSSSPSCGVDHEAMGLFMGWYIGPWGCTWSGTWGHGVVNGAMGWFMEWDMGS